MGEKEGGREGGGRECVLIWLPLNLGPVFVRTHAVFPSVWLSLGFHTLLLQTGSEVPPSLFPVSYKSLHLLGLRGGFFIEVKCSYLVRWRGVNER